MKIGIVTNLYPPIARGGAEKVAKRIVDELTARGHEVFVISTMPFKGFSSLNPTVDSIDKEKVYRYFPLNIYHILNDYKFPFPIRAKWHLIDLFNPFSGILLALSIVVIIESIGVN